MRQVLPTVSLGNMLFRRGGTTGKGVLAVKVASEEVVGVAWVAFTSRICIGYVELMSGQLIV